MRTYSMVRMFRYENDTIRKFKLVKVSSSTFGKKIIIRCVRPKKQLKQLKSLISDKEHIFDLAKSCYCDLIYRYYFRPNKIENCIVRVFVDSERYDTPPRYKSHFSKETLRYMRPNYKIERLKYILHHEGNRKVIRMIAIDWCVRYGAKSRRADLIKRILKRAALIIFRGKHKGGRR